MSRRFKLQLKWTSSLTLAAHKPQTYTYSINYSCPRRQGLLPSTICSLPRRGVGGWTESQRLYLQRQEMHLVAFRESDRLIPLRFLLETGKGHPTTTWKWRTLKGGSCFSTPDIIFTWHNNLTNYFSVEEMPFPTHSTRVDLLFFLAFLLSTLSCFKVT